jgi:hypothetical protein
MMPEEKEKTRARKKRYRETHKAEIQAYSKRYRDANQEKWRESARHWYETNKERAKARMREYDQAHTEAHRARAREQYQADPEYINSRTDKRRERLRAFFLEQKKGKFCMRCGIADYRVLDFHHRDPSEKEIDLSKAVANNWGEQRILQEIAKCDVLCANCHRILHWEERNGTEE